TEIADLLIVDVVVPRVEVRVRDRLHLLMTHGGDLGIRGWVAVRRDSAVLVETLRRRGLWKDDVIEVVRPERDRIYTVIRARAEVVLVTARHPAVAENGLGVLVADVLSGR